MTILFLTNYFYPETFRGNDIAFHLAAQGHDVTVLTNIPNYPKGKFFDGYGLFRKRKEVINGVKVIRVPIVPRGNGGSIRMMLNYATGTLFMCLYSLYQAIAHKYDAIFVQQLSPVFIGLPAVLIKKLRKTPIYFWILDLWPESLAAGGINNKRIIGGVDKFVKFIYRNCHKILISSLSFRKILLQRGVPNEKIEYFPNWSEDAIASGEIKQIPQLPDGFKILFAGNIGEAQNFDNLMQAMLRLKDNRDIKWIIVGDGRKFPELKEFVERNGLSDNVKLLGRFDISYMPSFFDAADIMLVSLTDNPGFNSTLPAKVQAYMSCAKPILGMANGEARQIIDIAKCGFCTGADDIDGFVEIVQKLPSLSKSELRQLGENGKAYYAGNFDKTKCFNHLDNLLQSQQ